jgi:hypothetical protein
LLVFKDTELFCIRDRLGEPHNLPFHLPKLSPQAKQKAREHAPEWERALELTIELYGSYRKFRLLIVRFEEAIERRDEAKTQQLRYASQSALDGFLKEAVTDFEAELTKLKRVADATQIAHLNKISLCCNTIMGHLGSREREDISNAIQLAEKIADWLLEAIRQAEEMLREYFSAQGTGKD